MFYFNFFSNISKITVISFAAILFIAGCNKDSIQQKFLNRGETQYTSKVDSIQVYGGKNRVMLAFKLPSDQRISGYKIFWNDGNDSLIVHSVKIQDSIYQLIDNLAENNYNFNVYTTGENGLSSVKAIATGHAYGDDYNSLLQTRVVDKLSRDNDDLVIQWISSESPLLVKTKINFKDLNDLTQTVSVAGTDVSSVLTDFPTGGSFEITSFYIPDAFGLDTFSVSQTYTLSLKEVELDKSVFTIERLPSDASLNPATAPNESPAVIFDGNTVDRSLTINAPLPGLLTINLKKKWKLTKMQLWTWNPAVRAYVYASPKEWEVYGSNTLNDDMSTWDLIGHFDFKKPSGAPYTGARTPADYAYAASGGGDDLTFPSDVKEYQYIRFKFLKPWQLVENGAPTSVNYVYFSEISLFGMGESF